MEKFGRQLHFLSPSLSLTYKYNILELFDCYVKLLTDSRELERRTQAVSKEGKESMSSGNSID